MKRIFPISLMVWPYLFPLIFHCILFNENLPWKVQDFVFQYYFILAFLLCILNYFNAFFRDKNETPLRKALYCMVIKFVHMPCFLAIYVIFCCLVFISIIPFFMFFTPFIGMLLIFCSICWMSAAGVYGISAAITAQRQGMISKKSAILYAVLLSVLIIDVPVSVIFYLHLLVKDTIQDRRSLRSDSHPFTPEKEKRYIVPR